MYGDEAAEQHEKDQPTDLLSDYADRQREEIRMRRLETVSAALQEAYNQGWRDARHWPHDVEPRVYRRPEKGRV